MDETNTEIQRENVNFKNKINELKDKLTTETERNSYIFNENEKLKIELNKRDEEIFILKEELKKQEDKYYRKIEDNEKIYKEKIGNNTHIIREEYVNNVAKLNSEVEGLILETEKLKLDKNNLIVKLEEYEQLFREKELDFKKILNFKDQEYDNLAKTIRELQNELRELESNYRSKSEEFRLQINQMQNDDEKKIIIINTKEKQILDQKTEINKLGLFIDDLNDEINKLKGELLRKEDINSKLNNDLNNFLNDLKLYEYKLRTNDETFERSKEEFYQRFKSNESEKEILLKEKKVLKEEIQKLRRSLTDMENYYTQKKRDIEFETTEFIEKNNLEILKNFKLKEEELLIEIKNLKTLLDEREKTKNDVIYKLENKIYKVLF